MRFRKEPYTSQLIAYTVGNYIWIFYGPYKLWEVSVHLNMGVYDMQPALFSHPNLRIVLGSSAE